MVTRARAQAGPFCRELLAQGAIPLCLPAVQFVPPEDCKPLDRELRRLADFDWLLLTSQNAMRSLLDRCRELGFELSGALPSRTESATRDLLVAAVGPATAEAASRAGLVVNYVARNPRASSLAAELAPRLRGARVFWPHSDRSSAELVDALRDAGAHVVAVVAYRAIRADSQDVSVLDQLRSGSADVVTFFSPSAFRNLAEDAGLDTLRAIYPRTAFAAIGPVTASALSEAGLHPQIVSAGASVASFVAALSAYFSLAAPPEGRQ